MGFKTWILQHCKISIYFSGVWLICGRRCSSCFWLDEMDVVFQRKSLSSGGSISEFFAQHTIQHLTGIGSRRRTLKQDFSALKFVSHLDHKSRASFNAASLGLSEQNDWGWKIITFFYWTLASHFASMAGQNGESAFKSWSYWLDLGRVGFTHWTKKELWLSCVDNVNAFTLLLFDCCCGLQTIICRRVESCIWVNRMSTYGVVHL